MVLPLTRLDGLSNSPSHDRSNESEATTNLQKFGRICQTLWRGIVSDLIVGCCNEAEENDKGEEDDDKRHVGSERAQQKYETDKRHDNGVMSLCGIPRLAKSATYTIGADKSVGRIAGVCLVDPMAAIDDEDDEGECIPKNKLGNASNIHGDAAHEVPGAAGSDQGSRIGTFELEEAPHCCRERDQKPEDTEQSWIT